MSAYPRTNESSCHPVPTSLHRDIKPSLESFIFWQAVSDLSPVGQGWRRQPSTPAPASSRRHAARLPFRLSARALTGALRCAPLPNTTTASAPTAAVTEGAVPRSRSPRRNAAGQVLRGRWERPGRGVRAHGALIPSAHSPFPAQTALECRRGTEQRAPCPPSRPAGSRLTVAAPSAGSTGRRRPSAWRELAPLGPAPRPPPPRSARCAALTRRAAGRSPAERGRPCLRRGPASPARGGLRKAAPLRLAPERGHFPPLRARPSGCLCRVGRSPNHTSGGEGGNENGKKKQQQKKKLGGEKLETRHPRSRRHRGSLFPARLLPPRSASTHRLQPDARPVRDAHSRPRLSGPAGAGLLLPAGIFLSPSKPSRPPPRAQPFPIPAGRARGEAPPGADSPRQPGCEYRQLCRCHTG